jgi:hypothetical protein
MPSVKQIFTLEVTPEKFIEGCTEVELQEVMLLAERRLKRLERMRRRWPQSEAPEIAPNAGREIFRLIRDE